MKPGPRICLDKIEEALNVDAAPIRLFDLITEIIIANGWSSSGDDAAEKGEKWLPFIKKTIESNIQRSGSSKFGHTYDICFNSLSDDFVQGVCFSENGESADVAEAKRKRAKYVGIIKLIDDLDPDEFEALCGKILELLGVETPLVTRHSSDQGIDFFGRWKLESVISDGVLPPAAERQLQSWVVGQAKAYRRTKISTDAIRELVGSVELAKSKTFAVSGNPLSGLDVRPCDSIFSMFITTGVVSKDSWKLFENSGVVVLDAELLGIFLADRSDKMPKLETLYDLKKWIS